METSLNLDIIIDKDAGSKKRGRKKMKETKKSVSLVNNRCEVTPLDLAPAEEVPLTVTDTLCGYCHKGHLDDPLQAGRLYSVAGAASHYFCMLFTQGSSQLGQDSEGLFGFYGREVLLQLERSRERKCRYCSKTGATARCAKKACKVAMHFPCGQEAGATFQFMGKMLVYCAQHRVRQKTEHLPSPPDRDCVICYEEVEKGLELKKLRSPCCGRHLHRTCVQQFAMSSGEKHFKCPACNDVSGITREFRRLGIYVPVKDAEWELPTQAAFYNFGDMYSRSHRCEAAMCRAKTSRSYNEVETEWEIVLCQTCGTNGVHLECGELTGPEAEEYMCQDCGGKGVGLLPKPVEERRRGVGASSSLESSTTSSTSTSITEGSSSESSRFQDLIRKYQVNSTYDSIDDLLNSSTETVSDEDSTNDFSDSVITINTTTESIQELIDTSNEDISDTVGDVTINEIISKSDSPSLPPSITSNESNFKDDFLRSTAEVREVLAGISRSRDIEEKAKEAFLNSLNKTNHIQGKEPPIEVGSQPNLTSFPRIKVRSDLLVFGNSNFDMENIMNKSPEQASFEDIETTLATEESEYTDEDIGLNISEDSLPESHLKKKRFGVYLLKTVQNKESLQPKPKRKSNFMEPLLTYLDYRVVQGRQEPLRPTITMGAVDKLIVEKQGVSSKGPPPSESKEDEIDEDYVNDVEDINLTMLSDVTLGTNVDRYESTKKVNTEFKTKDAVSDTLINELLDSPVKKTFIPADITVNSFVMDGEVSGTNIIESIHDKQEIPKTPKRTPSSRTEITSVSPELHTSNSVIKGAPTSPRLQDLISKYQVFPSTDIPPTCSKRIDEQSTEGRATVVPTLNEKSPADKEETRASTKSSSDEPWGSSKYKPGPKSKKVPTESAKPWRASPSKIKLSIEENIKRFEELKKKSYSPEVVEVQSDQPPVSTEIKEPSPLKRKSEVEDDGEKKVVRYRPGPKSRKKHLVIKDKENEECSSNQKHNIDDSKNVDNNSKNVDNNSKNVDINSKNIDINSENVDINSKNVDINSKTVDKTVDESIKVTHDMSETPTQTIEPLIQDASISEIIPNQVESQPPTTESKRASKRPYQCPVCQGWFRLEIILQQHMAKIHFWNRLLGLCQAGGGQDQSFLCPEMPCRYFHRNQNIVAGHLATEHKVVFRIARSLFPSFQLPDLAKVRGAPVMVDITEDTDENSSSTSSSSSGPPPQISPSGYVLTPPAPPQPAYHRLPFTPAPMRRTPPPPDAPTRSTPPPPNTSQSLTKRPASASRPDPDQSKKQRSSLSPMGRIPKRPVVLPSKPPQTSSQTPRVRPMIPGQGPNQAWSQIAQPPLKKPFDQQPYYTGPFSQPPPGYNPGVPLVPPAGLPVLPAGLPAPQSFSNSPNLPFLPPRPNK